MRGSLLAGLVLLASLTPALARPATPGLRAAFGSTVQLAQAQGIKGSDPETADRGQGNTGWVQAPTPRGEKAPEQTAQGANSRPVGSSSGSTGDTGQGAGQLPAGQNPGTAMPTPLPGPAGIAPGAPDK